MAFLDPRPNIKPYGLGLARRLFPISILEKKNNSFEVQGSPLFHGKERLMDEIVMFPVWDFHFSSFLLSPFQRYCLGEPTSSTPPQLNLLQSKHDMKIRGGLRLWIYDLPLLS